MEENKLIDNNLNTIEIVNKEKSIRKGVKDMPAKKKKKTYRTVKRSKKSVTLTRRKKRQGKGHERTEKEKYSDSSGYADIPQFHKNARRS